jgi:hypothetical protein
MVAKAPAARRLLVPANRPPSREHLFAAEPFFLRPSDAQPVAARPRILSFESDAFMDDFLAVAVGKRLAPPRLLPWRDWAEPPAGLVDAAGAPRYPTTAPTDLVRRPPGAADIDPASGPAMDDDGIPHGLVSGEKTTTPPWLRKLYLPTHERFNLIGFDLICGAAGLPRVARSRVKGSGAVIRRLVPDPTQERWEDWVTVDEKHGAWLPLLPASLHTGTPVDPAALTPPAGLEARLRTLFGLTAATPLPPIALASQPLVLLPPDAGHAADHCTLYGYLPVFSAAREIPLQPLTGSTVAEIAAALAQQSRSRLDTLFQHAADLRDAARPHLRSLLDATVLPARPGTAAAASAETFAAGLAASAPPGLGQVGNVLGRSIDLALRQALARLWRFATDPTTDDDDIAGTVRSADTLWADSHAATAASEPGLFDNLPDFSPVPGNQTAQWLAASAPAGAWDTLLRLRLHQLMDAWLAGAALPPPALGGASLINPGHLALVVAMALLRLRGCRLTIAASINQALYGDRKPAELKAFAADGKRELGLPALAETIEAVLAMEAARSDITAIPPWPQVALPAQWVLDVHDDGQAIARIYARFDDGLATAGNAAIDQLKARAASIEGQLDSALHTCDAGLDIDAARLSFTEQPLCGLLVLPGIRLDSTAFTAFRNAAGARYIADPERAALPEARTDDAQPRLRFDAEHLYAAWAWVRVAGRTPCEPERIVWTQRTEPFSIADPTDLLGARPASIQMPDIPKLLRDIPRIARARAKPFAGMASPPGSGVVTGEDMADTRRDFGIGMICNFGIPILTICALILFKIIFTVLIALPSFSWMLFLKFCLPFPKRGP